MIISRGSDPVADWTFSSRHAALQHAETPAAALEWALGHLPMVLSTLNAGRLLIPNRIVVTLSKARPLGAPRHLVRDIGAHGDIATCLDGISREFPGVTLLAVDVRGEGAIVGGSGERWLPDVVSVEASGATLWGEVAVATWCDAWLPCDLRGRPQPEVCSANAPRLRAALEEIERQIGVAPRVGDSKFSVAHGYVLSCQGDEEDPLEMAWLGYDESWIVAE